MNETEQMGFVFLSDNTITVCTGWEHLSDTVLVLFHIGKIPHRILYIEIHGF